MSRPPPPPARVREASWVAFGVSLACYLATAARSLQGGDTAEMAWLALKGGVAHPPGYPLWLVVAPIARLLPGPPFFRASLVSAAAGAAAAGLLVPFLARLTGSVTASLAASLAWGLSPLAWSLSSIPEVFSTAMLAAVLVLHASMRLAVAQEREWPRALAAGAAMGLGLCAHQTLLALAPFAGGAALVAWLRSRRAAVPAAFAVGVVAGLLPFALLPLCARAASADAFVWGDPATVHGWTAHVLRSQYGTLRLGTGGGVRANPFGLLLRLPRDLVLYLPVAALGIAAAWKRMLEVTLGFLMAVILAGIALPALFVLPPTALGAEVASRFFLLPELFLAPFVAFGIAALEERLPRRAVIAAAFLALPAVAIPGFLAADWRGDPTLDRWTFAALDGVAPGAVILGEGDVTGPAFGFRIHELGERRDVRYVDLNLIRLRWYWDRAVADVPEIAEVPFDAETTHLGKIAAAIAAKRPLYVTPWVASKVALPDWPEGFLVRVAPEGTGRPPPQQLQPALAAATARLGTLPAPVDAWSASFRQGAALPWAVLGDDYERAGDAEHAAQCREIAAALAAPAPFGVELR